MSGVLLPNITRVNAGNPLFQPFGTGGGGASTINANSISTQNITITSGNIFLNGNNYISTIGNQLFYYNGTALEPFTAISSISSIEAWSEYPAISSINADGNDILNANIVEAGAISSMIVQTEELHVSSIYAREIFTSTLTALSTIQSLDYISSLFVVADDVSAIQINALTIDASNGFVYSGILYNGQSIITSNLNTTYGVAQIKFRVQEDLDPFPYIELFDGVVNSYYSNTPTQVTSMSMFGSSNQGNLLATYSNDNDPSPTLLSQIRLANQSIQFLDGSVPALGGLPIPMNISSGIVYANNVSAQRVFVSSINGYSINDFISSPTVPSSINISSIITPSLLISTGLYELDSDVANNYVSTFKVTNGSNNAQLIADNVTGSNLVYGSNVTAFNQVTAGLNVVSLAGGLYGQALGVVGGVTASNGSNFLGGATVCDGGSSDVVLQTGVAGAQGFRVSPLGVTTTAAGYNTVTTGVYQSYTSGQYIDLLAGGTLTLSHGSAFGDNAVVVKNFAGNANARMWFRNGGDISSLTTLNTQDINATGTILGASGAIQTFGVNTIVALTGGTLPILNVPNTANISTLNVSSVNVNVIDAIDISAMSVTAMDIQTANAEVTSDLYTNYLFNNTTYTSTVNIAPNGQITGNTSTFMTNFSLVDSDKVQADIVLTNSISSVFTSTGELLVSSINANPVPLLQYGFSTLQSAEYVIEVPKFYANMDWAILATPTEPLNNSIHASTLSVSSFSIHGQTPGAGVPFQWMSIGNYY